MKKGYLIVKKINGRQQVNLAVVMCTAEEIKTIDQATTESIAARKVRLTNKLQELLNVDLKSIYKPSHWHGGLDGHFGEIREIFSELHKLDNPEEYSDSCLDPLEVSQITIYDN